MTQKQPHYNLIDMIEAVQGFGNSAYTVIPSGIARDILRELKRLYELETAVTKLAQIPVNSATAITPHMLHELLT